VKFAFPSLSPYFSIAVNYIALYRTKTYKAAIMRYLTFFFILCSSISFAQFDKETTRLDANIMSPMIFEAIPYWSSDTISIELIVLYRVSSSFLFFTKTNNTQQESYQARGELVIEIMDSNNATVERDFHPMRIERTSVPTEDAPLSDEIQGIFTFKLKKGFYKIVFEAKDSESGKSFINRDTKVDAQTISASGLNVSPIMFSDPIRSDSSSSGYNIFFPINRGGNIIIGQPCVCSFQVVSPDTSSDIHLTWKIQSKNEDDDEISQELQGEQCFQQSGILTVIENAKRVSFTMRKSSAHSRFIFAPIPIERLNTGTYLLTVTVTQGALKSVKKLTYKVIWPLRPYSLSDPKLAVDALKLIATEKEIDQMSTFSSNKSRKAFQAFWQKRNPDTTRAYNSVMAEYYRRVDESIKRFSTTNEKDGYRTDRGRIYILYGAPSITNRLLKPNTAPAEIWTYEKLKKRFTFRDLKKNSNFILIKTEND
jgi:GWxTD domain-containing protein